MDEIKTLASNISSILPKRTGSVNDGEIKADREKSAREKAESLIRQHTEAKMRKEEKALEKREATHARKQQALEAKVLAAEAQEAHVEEVLKYDADMRVKQTLDSEDPYFPQLPNLAPAPAAPSPVPARSPQAMLAQEFGMPTSRPEVLKLLASLNVNLNMQLSKNDTANLLACLLTCNSQQIDAIYSNPRIPISIKIVIKRLKDDLKVGNMSTLEKLWDRVFGKGEMIMNLPGQETMQGIIPSTPISREAYIVIRDTLIK